MSILKVTYLLKTSEEKTEKWKEFVDDLKGNNDAGSKVELTADNKHIEQQLSDWMDFWSPGNHDDRTLAIVF